MDLISEWITPGGIVLAMGIIIGLILGWVLRKLWVSIQMVAYRLLPEPIKRYGHYALFVGVLIFAVAWTIYNR
jgi:predicted lysophospholipase L1 biosynthesis ABC-type transport system permease subunit